MTGGFWQNNGGWPTRRRRSLLGRQNRSDNDLPHHDTQLFQQQLLQPHTPIVLPENVKTILIAGTPECWSLSSSAEIYSPTNNNCDASLLTTVSELSPSSRTIDEDEPLPNSDGLDWMRLRHVNSTSKRKSSPQLTSLRKEQQRHTKEPSSMVVMYRSPSAPSVPPQQALEVWLSSVDALVKSREMAALIMATGDIVKSAGGIAVRTALLPVTLPFHVVCVTKDFVGWALHQALVQTGTLPQLKCESEQQASKSEHQSQQPGTISSENTNHNEGNPLEGILQLVPLILGAAGKVKDEIGAAVVDLVTPPQPKEKPIDKQGLQRLIIPGLSDKVLEHPVVGIDSIPGTTKADVSKYLLRVEDLDVKAPTDKNTVVIYIDLDSQYRDMTLVTQCLEKLASRALSLATTHAPSIPPATASGNTHVEWRTEGATAKLLRKKSRQSLERWEETIRSEVLIWSGNFKKDCSVGSISQQFSLFLAHGVVDRMSPREFLELMWDNSRTCEYNNYCLGREDIFHVDDEVLSPKKAHTGMKVVRSETRVPFTSLSVVLHTMMHCRPLPGGPQEGYIIVSRSLNSGSAGCHTVNSKNIQKSKSEILWGVNVLRSVPGHPGHTELTTLSQVASSMVPNFLSQRIGVMGVEDFFRSIRNPPKVAASKPETPIGATAPTVQL